jgi:Predicted metal-dependent protease of the PAD1/JAB1 superfamily
MKSSTEQAIRDHAIEEYPRECCGLVVVVDGNEQYFPCRNIAESPEKTFALSPKDNIAAENMGEVIGLAHSHPKMMVARMSEADLVSCETSGLVWHLVCVYVDDAGYVVTGEEMISYEPNGYVAPLLGRKFSHGVLDCYALIRDYYKQVLQIELPDYERRDDWWNKGDNLYMDNFANAGFAPVSARDIQIGDIILMQIRSPVANHAGVYIGDGMMLHHLTNRLSSRELYDGYFQENTRMILRRKK